MKVVIATLCFFTLILGAVAVLWFGANRSLNAQASETWPTVSGTVTSTSSFVRPGRLRVILSYSYTVDGQTYENDRVSFSPKPADQSDFFGLLENMSLFLSAAQKNEGSSITVYYQPDDPENSVLVPSGAIFFFIYLFGAILMLLSCRFPYWIMTGQLNERFR